MGIPAVRCYVDARSAAPSLDQRPGCPAVRSATRPPSSRWLRPARPRRPRSRRTHISPGRYAGGELKGFTARDAQPLYTDALQAMVLECRRVSMRALAKGPASGSGVLLGTTDGRIVVSESVHVFPTPEGRQEVRRRPRDRRPAASGTRVANSINRVFVQYPQLPPIPTFAADTVARAGSTVVTTFEGTSRRRAALAGSTALITWDNYVAEASVRIAVAQPGELDSLSQSVFTSVDYNGRSGDVRREQPEARAAGRRPRARTSSRAPRRTARSRSSRPHAPGLPRARRAAEPPRHAYVYSGVHGAVRGFAGQDATAHVAAKPEIIVFARPADADRYLKSHSNLATCFSDLYKRWPTSRFESRRCQRVPKRGTDSSPKTADAEDRRLRIDVGRARRRAARQGRRRRDDGREPRRLPVGPGRFVRPDLRRQGPTRPTRGRPGSRALAEVSRAFSRGSVAEVGELQRDVEIVVAHGLDRGLQIVALLAADRGADRPAPGAARP